MNEEKGNLPLYPESYWLDSVELPAFAPLNKDLKVDVAIVGGGITGITTAYLLANDGLKVALLDAGRVLNGTTGHTTAKITAQHDLIYNAFINHIGRNKARLYYEANSEALAFIEETVNKHSIDCDFKKQHAYLYATTDEYAEKLEKEYKAYIKLKIDGELSNEIPFNIKVKKVLSMKDQAQFHPLKYLKVLLEEFKNKGGLIFEETVAVNIKEKDHGAVVLTRNEKRVEAKHVLSCSHFPFYEGAGLYSTRMYAERSYVLAVKTKMEYPDGMYLSVDQPSRSLRSIKENGESLVIVSGESHKTGQGKDTLAHYTALEAFGKEVLQYEEVINRWSTQDLITLDKIPYIGPITADHRSIFIATGYRKWGMTNGTAAAKLLRDLVMKSCNPYKDLYSPSRFYADPSLKTFFVENADVVKHLIKGKLEIPEKNVNDLAKDEGAAIFVNGQRRGAYKDPDGNLHIVDTTCTHIGCEVNWNHGDRTWDCPCHGSRFSYTGEVIEGPAEKPLQRVDHKMLENFTSEDSGY